MRVMKRNYDSQIDGLSTECESYKRSNRSLKSDLEVLTNENLRLKSTLSMQSTSLLTVESEKAALKSHIEVISAYRSNWNM